MNLILQLSFVLFSLNGFFTDGMPLHASCKITWKFGQTCGGVKTAIEKQISAWNGSENCKDGGEKCLYWEVSSTATSIEARHQTPKKQYVDDLTFDFEQQGAICQVKGNSRSETWYALLDYGTNYCNLHNLIIGAKLDKAPGYSEDTSNSQCTQYSSADCDKY